MSQQDNQLLSFKPFPQLRLQDWSLALLVLFLAFTVRSVNIGSPFGQYFDEIYYAAAASDYLHGRADSNEVHPPLGKLHIAAGMLACRTLNRVLPKTWQISSPVQRRAASLFCGLVLVWFTFLLAYRVSGGSRSLALLAMFLASIDFLQVVMARICMLDMIAAMWIVVGAYLAWCCVELAEQQDKRSYRWLLASALALGMSIACKWNGIFAAAALMMLLFFLALPVNAKEKAFCLDSYGCEGPQFGPNSSWLGVKKRWELVKSFHPWRRLFVIGGSFFSAWLLVYFCAYIPVFVRSGLFNWHSWQTIYNSHALMVTFHYDSQQFCHNYLSFFWQWPFVIRPVWLAYTNYPETLTCSGIIAFGCVIFWWTGLVYVGELFALGLSHNSRSFLFITFLWLAQWLCWAVSTTGGFIYYMLPGVPFMAIATAFVTEDWQNSRLHWLVIAFILLLTVFFLAYWPVLTNDPISVKYFDVIFPAWLPRWR